MKKNLGIMQGEVRAELIGADLERLLNACAQSGLTLRELCFREDGALCASIAEGELPRLEKLARLCQCELRALEIRGGSVRTKQLRRRSRLLAFAAVCALLLTLSCLFIWDIDVKGNERLSKGEILRCLADCGVSEGCFWPAADAERVRSEMLLRCEDLAWMTLNVRGSRATVLVLEREKKPEIYDERAEADLIASRAGVVRELSVKNGRALAARGELVYEGQTLVSGTMESPAGELRRVRAEGSVTAETWPERTIYLSPGTREKTRKNGFRLILGLRLGKNRIDLVTNSRKELDECDKIMKEYTLGIEGVFRFPLGISVEVYRPYSLGGKATADPDGAKARAIAALRAETDGELLSCVFDQEEERLVLRAHCLENIAVTAERKDP